MGVLADALAKGFDITYKGKTYRLSPATLDVQAEYEVWFERQAWRAYDRRARHTTEAEARALRRELVQSIAAKEYSFHSNACRSSLASMEGMSEMLFLMLAAGQTLVPEKDIQEVSREMVAEMMKSDEFDRIGDQLLLAMGLDPTQAGPKGPAPAPTTTA